MWVGLIHSFKGLKKKDWSLLKRKEFCFQTAFGLKTVISTPSEIFRLLACLAGFGMCQTPQLHEPIREQKSIFLSSSLSYHLYAYKLYNPIDWLFLWRSLTNTEMKEQGKIIIILHNQNVFCIKTDLYLLCCWWKCVEQGELYPRRVDSRLWEPESTWCVLTKKRKTHYALQESS